MSLLLVLMGGLKTKNHQFHKEYFAFIVMAVPPQRNGATDTGALRSRPKITSENENSMTLILAAVLVQNTSVPHVLSFVSGKH